MGNVHHISRHKDGGLDAAVRKHQCPSCCRSARREVEELGSGAATIESDSSTEEHVEVGVDERAEGNLNGQAANDLSRHGESRHGEAFVIEGLVQVGPAELIEEADSAVVHGAYAGAAQLAVRYAEAALKLGRPRKLEAGAAKAELECQTSGSEGNGGRAPIGPVGQGKFS